MKRKSIYFIVVLVFLIAGGYLSFWMSRNTGASQKGPYVKKSVVQETGSAENDPAAGILQRDTGNDKITENEDIEDAGNEVENEEFPENDFPSDRLVEVNGLVELLKVDSSFLVDLKYASDDNFTGRKIYSRSLCLIHKNTAVKLVAANNEFKELGYSIKVFDAYRPYSAQKTLWDAASDKAYVASPTKGSIHNRGAAVDITLVDREGHEVEMPSAYDEFSKRSHLAYKDCPEIQIKNRELLGSIMVKNGFRRISKEWWHFEDTDASEYPLLDISFEDFLQH